MRKKIAIATLVLTLASGAAFSEDVFTPGKPIQKRQETTWVQKVVNFMNSWKLF